jgi:hypothetical protein
MTKKVQILVIDGQGGKLGRQLLEKLRAALPASCMTAVGTNSLATANMLKAEPDIAATGENAVRVACRTAQIIVGPLGIVIADSLHGEITPGMAVAVGQSQAAKVLIPIDKCNHYLVGIPECGLARLIEMAITRILLLCADFQSQST